MTLSLPRKRQITVSNTPLRRKYLNRWGGLLRAHSPISPRKIGTIALLTIMGGIFAALWPMPLFGQQNAANLQWLPHPAVVERSVRPVAAEVPPASPSAGHPSVGGNTNNPSVEMPNRGGALPEPSSGTPSVPGPAVNPLADPFGDIAPPTSSAPSPKVVEPPYLPEGGSKPIAGGGSGVGPMPGRPTQVRAECLTDGNLLLPIHKLTTRIGIDPNVHPEISAQEEARLRQAGQPTRLEQLSRAKTEFDAKMWCDPPPTPLPGRMLQPWPETTMTWKASALCHKPLYFEQAHLERYGHTTGPLTQPIVSAGHFYLMMPILPYQLALWPPYECIYPLGYYRPGSCAPYYLDPIPLSIRAGLAEAGAWVGGVFAIP